MKWEVWCRDDSRDGGWGFRVHEADDVICEESGVLALLRDGNTVALYAPDCYRHCIPVGDGVTVLGEYQGESANPVPMPPPEE